MKITVNFDDIDGRVVETFEDMPIIPRKGDHVTIKGIPCVVIHAPDWLIYGSSVTSNAVVTIRLASLPYVPDRT